MLPEMAGPALPRPVNDQQIKAGLMQNIGTAAVFFCKFGEAGTDHHTATRPSIGWPQMPPHPIAVLDHKDIFARKARQSGSARRRKGEGP
jgi:hypothetical protein